METVFDYNITPEECKALGIGNKETFLAVAGADSNNFALASLFQLRGDKSAVAKYLSKLPPEMANDFQRTVAHP